MQNPLTLVQFNLENCFIYLDNYNGEDLKSCSEEQWQSFSRSTERLKPLKKVWALAHTILDIDPDIVLVNEMGGFESCENFCRHFLDNHYKPLLKEGNSDRGIDVGYIVKKDLPYSLQLYSHKDRPINFLYPHEVGTDKSSHYFSRDVAELRISKDQNSPFPDLVILGVHLKSKLDPDGLDPLGRARRAAELKTLIEIYNEIEHETNGTIPILVGGDFNGVAGPIDTEPEFQYLYENSTLQDVLELAECASSERYTQVTFNSLGNIRNIQIDYFFLAHKFRELIDASGTRVYKYKSDMRVELPYPTTLEQRSYLPSDHYPVVLKLKPIP